jgi:hypothetical protein
MSCHGNPAVQRPAKFRGAKRNEWLSLAERGGWRDVLFVERDGKDLLFRVVFDDSS